ncbi:MAG: hypothetical protein GTN76_07570 [Candidatus Aenigmarchaeota archaeon]|nr:hypothetical protein [Candidatus Aenigmarchaeota archaeon]
MKKLFLIIVACLVVVIIVQEMERDRSDPLPDLTAQQIRDAGFECDTILRKGLLEKGPKVVRVKCSVRGRVKYYMIEIRGPKGEWYPQEGKSVTIIYPVTPKGERYPDRAFGIIKDARKP